MFTERETLRCAHCSRILGKGFLAPGSVWEVKCSCNTMTTITVGPLISTVVNRLSAPTARSMASA